MAHTTIQCTGGAWTLLTDSDVTALRVQNLSLHNVILQATASASPPSSDAGAVRLGAGEILLPDVPLADLFPGVTGAARVYAFTGYVTAFVSVSHA